MLALLGRGRGINQYKFMQVKQDLEIHSLKIHEMADWLGHVFLALALRFYCYPTVNYCMCDIISHSLYNYFYQFSVRKCEPKIHGL